ncbi:MAG: stage II sporulation protein R [Sporolactobacillus sp.]
MKRSIALITLLSINLVLSFFFWESQSAKADQTGPIPADAIRLRILANSDSPADQAVKHTVRDAVNQNIERWVGNLKTSAQAERVIARHLPELRSIVKEELARLHADSNFRIALGKADFPTKMYGTYVYPAGHYRALVITLGEGQGANWWCVLFPPLCFLDFSNSEAVRTANDARAADATTAQPTGENATSDAGVSASQVSSSRPSSSAAPAVKQKTVQVHFAVVDLFKKLWHGLFG